MEARYCGGKCSLPEVNTLHLLIVNTCLLGKRLFLIYTSVQAKKEIFFSVIIKGGLSKVKTLYSYQYVPFYFVNASLQM